MNDDDYLWDRTGEPDAEVKRMEALLSRFQHRGTALELPALPDFPLRHWTRWQFWVPRLAGATVLAAVAVWLAAQFVATPNWKIVNVEGAAAINNVAAQKGARLGKGKSIETGSSGHLTLQVGQLGRVDVGPNTRLDLLQATRDREEARLERGTIHAEVTAPPYVFLVHTPFAYALDMGCAYTLTVNPDGSGTLEVTEGWIQFQRDWVQSMVPAGADAEMRPGYGPGAPYFADAPEKFREALHIVNFDSDHPEARSQALTVVMAEARKRDAFTLLNLLHRVAPEDRGRLYDRLTEFLPPPPGVCRQHVIDGEWNELSPFWDELGLGHPKKGLKGPPRVEE